MIDSDRRGTDLGLRLKARSVYSQRHAHSVEDLRRRRLPCSPPGRRGPSRAGVRAAPRRTEKRKRESSIESAQPNELVLYSTQPIPYDAIWIRSLDYFTHLSHLPRNRSERNLNLTKTLLTKKTLDGHGRAVGDASVTVSPWGTSLSDHNSKSCFGQCTRAKQNSVDKEGGHSSHT